MDTKLHVTALVIELMVQTCVAKRFSERYWMKTNQPS